MNTITFDSDVADMILKMFCLQLDQKNRICDQDFRPAPSLDGKPVKKKEFAGIINTKDGMRIVRNDICSLIQLSDYIENKSTR